MPTGSSLVALEVEPQRTVQKTRAAGLLLFALAGGLTGLAAFGAILPFLSPGQSVVVSEHDDPNSAPAIAVAPVVFAQPWLETPFPIHVTPPGAQRGSYLQIDGLPALALLSEGHATRPGSWRVPVAKLATLKITSPATEDAKPRLAIALISRDGVIVSEAKPLLAAIAPERIGPHPAVRPSPPTQCSVRAAPAPAPAWIWPGARQEARVLVRKGDDALSMGSIAAARQTYAYAAEEMRWPTAALALAATHDPHELAHRAPFVAPDTERARHWYERAREVADARVDFYLQRLGPPTAGRPAEPLHPIQAEPAPLWVWFGATEAKTMVRWGDEALSRGYVGAARQIYEYGAVVMRWPTAALSLAATYDPAELKPPALRTVAPEPEKARMWYERSRELMSARIDFHLQRLGAPKEHRPARPDVATSCG